MRTLSLYCPACSGSRELDAALHCAHCKTTYPDLGGIPFLLPEPEHALARWEARAHSEQQLLRTRQALCDKALSAAASADQAAESTLARLTHLSNAYGQQLDCLGKLLEPLLGNRPGSDHTTYQALKTPGLQDNTTLFSYAGNLFRDWAWGEDENNQALAMLQSVAPEQWGNTLVLGAGGGRLAWDIACSGAQAVVAVDINPFTTLAAAQITRAGASSTSATAPALRLWEFPLAPIRTEDTAIEHRLAADINATPHALHFVLADARALPFDPESFDTVVTPWFTDVAQESARTTAQRINRLLKPGGYWLNFGSVAFANADPLESLLLPELCALVARNGFDEPNVIEQQGPYLRSPHSRFSRMELLHAFAARKNAGVAPLNKTTLPAWVSDPEQAVPALERFQEQALATQVHAFLMSLTDGQRSIIDIALVLEERRLMTAREAVPVVQDFLTKMHDGQ